MEASADPFIPRNLCWGGEQRQLLGGIGCGMSCWGGRSWKCEVGKVSPVADGMKSAFPPRHVWVLWLEQQRLRLAPLITEGRNKPWGEGKKSQLLVWVISWALQQNCKGDVENSGEKKKKNWIKGVIDGNALVEKQLKCWGGKMRRFWNILLQAVGIFFLKNIEVV